MSGCALRHAVELSGTTAPHSSENPFEKGQSDEFQLMLPIIGTKVLSATLSIDSKGVGSNWFVDDVTVGISSRSLSSYHRPFFPSLQQCGSTAH